MKRSYSQFTEQTTQEDYTQFTQEDMPRKYVSSKRRGKSARRANYGGVRARVPRSMSSNTCIIPRVVSYDTTLAADIAKGFGFSPTALWINGVSSTAIPGASELSALFDLMRISKVECTMMPSYNNLDMTASSFSTGSLNIPYVYEAFDATDGTNPSLADIQQMSSCKTHLLSKPIRRTVYPRLKEGSNIINVGQSAGDTYVQAGHDIAWNSWKVYADLESVTNQYVGIRFTFKIFYECRATK